MVSLLDVWERAQSGQVIEEKDWNMGLFRRLSELVAKYDIRRQKEEWINTDDSLLDRVYEAAVEFVATFGVYCRDLKRIVRFSEQEVREAVRTAPAEIEVGEGAEQTVIRHYDVEDRRKRNVMGGGHVPFSYDIIPAVVRSLVAVLPRIDYIEGMNFKTIEGREISNLGVAAYAHIKEVEAMRQGLREAGKPGVAVALYPISTNPVCMVSPLGAEGGLRPTDGVMVSMLPDFKIESGFITVSIIYQQYGTKLRVNGCDGWCGGTYVGSPQNAIVQNVGNVIAGRLCYGDTVSNVMVKHTDFAGGKCQVFGDVSWASSVSTQTVAKKTPFIGLANADFVHEMGSEESFKEMAVQAVRGTVSGANIWGVTKRTPSAVNCGNSPVEVQFHVEVADAVVQAGLNRAEANKLLADWAKELHRKSPPPPKGVSIADVYDLKKGEAKKEHRKLWEQMKAELRNRGLPLS